MSIFIYLCFYIQVAKLAGLVTIARCAIRIQGAKTAIVGDLGNVIANQTGEECFAMKVNKPSSYHKRSHALFFTTHYLQN